jgi:2',3'-cyclic-nucleotide 2'-phosphodiesterase (5'-nucleotidase family)
MRRRLSVLLSAVLLAGLVSAPVAAVPPGGSGGEPPSPGIAFAPIGRYDTGLADVGDEVTAAEIVAFSGTRMFVTNATDTSLDIVDFSDPTAPTLLERIDLSAYGGTVTSVAAHGSTLAVAVPADDKTDPGSVVFLDTSGDVLGVARVGALPDALTFTPDGKHVVVANEGEPSDDYGIDPLGSVSVITVRTILNPPRFCRVLPRLCEFLITYGAVRTLDFRAFNEGRYRHRELPAGVRIFGPGASVAQDLEPEYVAVSGDSETAWVTLQENNAIAIVDLDWPRIDAIVGLGYKDHSLADNGLDGSDRDGPGNDGLISIRNWPVQGMYQPDGIARFQAGGKTYLLTANEGDARAWGDFEEEVRLKDASLDPTAFPDAASLRNDDNIGRLTITDATGDTDGDGDLDVIHPFGARSFSVWSADGSQVWDSGDALEQIASAANPEFFNSDNSENNFDNRSDNKGPEPESVTTGVIGGRTYAFVGLERVSGVMVYDVTDPMAPSFVQYTNPRIFAGDAVGPDSGPEGLAFVPAVQSPTGNALLLVSNEVSGTVTIYEAHDPNGSAELTLLHNNDGESSLLPFSTTVNGNAFTYGGVAAFASVVDREIQDARGDFRSVGTVYAGDSMLASATMSCSLPPNPSGTPLYDALAQKQIPYDAHILGNHEFDFSPDLLERFIRGFETNGVLTQPFLSANLDFAGEPGYADLIDGDGLLVGYSTDGRVVAHALLHVDRVTGDRFGVVAATTPTLPTISSPRNVLVTSTDDATTAAVVQDEIDRLHDDFGVTKIVFVSHLQALSNDLTLIPLLHGVDVAVGGGGDELLKSDDDTLQPGESQMVFGTYPMPVVDNDGRTVYVVTTAGNYRYLGRLDVTFDAAGEVSAIDGPASGPVRVIPTDQPSPSTLTNLGVTDAVVPNADIVDSVTDPLTDCLAALSDPIATTEVPINVSNPAATGLGFTRGVRNGETNGGDLVADAYLAAYDANAASFGLPPRSATPVIAVQNGGGIRQNAGPVLPVGYTLGDPTALPGPISRRNTLDVMAFLTNVVTVIPGVSADDLKLILERAVSAPVEGGLLRNEGRFLQVGGLTVEVDLSMTAQVVTNPPAGLQYGTITTDGERVRNVTLDDGTPIVVDGSVVAGAPSVTIVTNNFTAFQGGDNYPTFVAQPTKIVLPLTYEQAVVDYILSFPVGASGLPTIPASDARYASPNGEGRIVGVP